MLGLSWTEMMVIGIVALIFIGPKELPTVMNRIGKIVGQIRRMGNEFQREINKTTGLDEVRNLRNSITAPLKKTSEDIRKEFNAMTPSGPKPSGVIKPKDPNAESVVDEIRAAAGMTPVKPVEQAAATAPKPAVALKAEPAEAKPAPAKKPAARKTPARAKAAPTSAVTTTELAPLDTSAKPASAKAAAVKKAAPKKAPAKQAAVTKTAADTDSAKDAKPAPRKRAAAKPKVPAADTVKAGDV